MKIAVMQPYFFPYIGYFQMMNAVDKFVLYDDVNYIKGGWINRNRILNGDRPMYIHLISNKVSPNKLIHELTINEMRPWKSKLMKQLESLYKKAPYFENVFPLLSEIVHYESSLLSDYLKNCISKTAQYLKISAEIVVSSRQYNNSNLERQERLIDICKKEGASQYINAVGGSELYSKEDFKKNGIDLYFIKTREVEYKQFDNDFVPNLSIIDVMMFNSVADIRQMLTQYDLV